MLEPVERSTTMNETEHQLAEIQKGLEEVENNEIATPKEVEAVLARWRTPLEPDEEQEYDLA